MLTPEEKQRIEDEERQRLEEERYRAQVRRDLLAPTSPSAPPTQTDASTRPTPAKSHIGRNVLLFVLVVIMKRLI